MKKFQRLITLTTAIALALPVVGNAATVEKKGGYVSGFLGITVPVDTTVTTDNYSSPPVFTSDTVSFDPGINLGATGGYDFGSIRLEGEISYKHSEIKSITDLSAGGDHYRAIDGTVGAAAFMANAFFDLHNNTPVTPYLGGGIGFATLHLSDTFGSGSNGRKWLYDSGDATVFAYQLGAGVDIAINRRFSMDIGYRYFATDTATFSNDFDREHSLKYESHNTSVGFRVKF
ncbi:MAG TPA: porin family protein [Desulfuromonadales bacterium]|nr:porin family protein [Desulfuromonadales bacterium]